MDFANKILNPFELNDIECTQPNYEIDPDFHYFNDVNISNVLKCNYYFSESFSKLLRTRGVMNEFSVMHHNIRSLPANLSEFTIFLEEMQHNFSIIGISETWLNEDNVNLYGISGYESFHNVRSCRRGGGVSIFVKNDITCNRRDDLSVCYDYVESIFVELDKNTTGHTKNVILGVVYRPPNQDIEQFIDSLKYTIDKIMHENKICYLMGDFNLDLFNHDTHSSTGEFLNTFLSCSFVPLINRPTRVTSNTCTLIDNIWCNHYQQLVNPDQGVFISSISDHYPVFHIDSVQSPEKTVKSRERRLINSRTSDKFIQNISLENWDPVYNNENPQNAYTIFSNIIKKHYSICFPKITVNGTYRNRLPWLTDGLKQSIQHKNKLYKLSMKKPILINRLAYQTYRNKLTHLLKRAEAMYYQQQFEECINNIFKTWSLIKCLIWKNKNSKISGQFLDSNSNVITDKHKISNMFNLFFSNVGINLAKNIKPSKYPPVHYLHGNYTNSMFITPVLKAEVSSIIKNLKNSAAGWDELSPKQMKTIACYIAEPLTYLCNISLTKGIFPQELKRANVIPLYKSGNQMSVNNYRPVSVLPVFSKIYEKIVYKRLYDYIVLHNILYDNQFGFREKHSSYMALITLMDHLTEALERGEAVIGLFLDFSKAFDTVDHEILLIKFHHYGIRGEMLNWFRDYLSNRTQCVLYDGVSSELLPVKCGVPQGSILGPL